MLDDAQPRVTYICILMLIRASAYDIIWQQMCHIHQNDPPGPATESLDASLHLLQHNVLQLSLPRCSHQVCSSCHETNTNIDKFSTIGLLNVDLSLKGDQTLPSSTISTGPSPCPSSSSSSSTTPSSRSIMAPSQRQSKHGSVFSGLLTLKSKALSAEE